MEDEQGRFGLADLGTRLRAGEPDGLRERALLAREMEYGTWGQLLETVRTGESGFQLAFGMSMWEYIAQHPKMRDYFHSALVTPSARRLAPALLAAYDFSRFDTVVDVGAATALFSPQFWRPIRPCMVSSLI